METESPLEMVGSLRESCPGSGSQPVIGTEEHLKKNLVACSMDEHRYESSGLVNERKHLHSGLDR